MNLRKNGFTLIETIVTLVVAGIIAFALISIIGQSFKIWSRAGEFSTIQTTARGVLSKMTQELLESVSVVGTPFTDSSEIAFSYDGNNDGQAELYRYYQSGDALLRTVGGGTPVTIGTGITGVLFSATESTGPSTYGTEVTIDLRVKEKGKDIESRTQVIPRGGRQ